MKKNFIAVVVVAALLSACASPRNATLKNGEISNITSAEATTLARDNIRQKKVEDVQKNAKPIFELKAQPGQTIQISGVESITVNVPQDLRELLAERPSEVSENVQVLDRMVRAGERVVVPLTLGKFAADVAKRRSDNAKAVALDNNATRRAEAQSQSETVGDLIDALTAKPDYFVLPAGATPVAPAVTE